MAIKSINYLPEIFRSDSNRKFLAATVDQLISESDPTVRLDSYVGRKNAPTWKSGDTYVTEISTERQNYQVEASTIVDSGQGKTEFYSNYQDLLQQIAYYGGFTNDHSRLFTNQSYSFDGVFDFDKFVNFTQYLWLPDGPPEVTVTASTVDISLEYNVTRSDASQSYEFTEFGTDRNPIITLVKGVNYKFRVNQPGRPFWIQIRPGITGSEGAAAEALNRQIYGLKNNGIDVGTIEFTVPTTDAQGSAARAALAATVDFATTLSYNQLQSHLNNVIKQVGGFDGVSQGLNGKTVVFLNRDTDTDLWTDPGNFDTGVITGATGSFDFTGEGYEYGTTVATANRYGVFQINTVDAGNGRQLIKLVPTTQVSIGEKVYVRAGNNYANVEFIKAPNGYFEEIEPVTAPLSELYYQDDTQPNFFGTIRLVEPGTSTIDVEADIVGSLNYTSPNKVALTNGLHIRFDNSVVPARYANNAYIVEGVGTAIKLINIGNFSVPEQYANASRLTTPDYITINRASRDLNGWSRSNRWFHIQTVELAAQYREDPTLLDLTGIERGKRPIIEFDPDIYLFEYGRQAKSPIDILDFTVTDAFQEVEGKTNYLVQLPNGITKQLTPGTRIIFANDADPDVRKRIYRVEAITTDAGTVLHLVSSNTQDLPIYSVSGASITSNLEYSFVPTVTFSDPLPGIGTRTATGTVVLKPTGVANVIVDYSGVNYVADPYVRINTDYTDAAEFDIVYKPFKQVDYIRIDNRGTSYSYAANVILTNPNEYWATVTNANVSSTGMTFELKAGNIPNPVTKTELATTGGNLNVTFSNVGLGYFQSNVTATISAPTTPAGVTATVNYVYLHANGAVKAVSLLNPGSGYLTAPTLTISTTGNTYPASTGNIGTITSTSTTLWDYLVPGMQVVANGIIGGSIITAVDNEANLVTINAPVVRADRLLETPVFGISTVEEGDTWAFKSNVDAGTYATVQTTVVDSTVITVDDTSMLDTGMIVSGGLAPIEISNVIITSVPTRIITAGEHNLQNGDLVYIRDVLGTTDLNFARYYVFRISDTAIELYTDSGLVAGSEQDSRNYNDYISGGTLTAYTIDYGSTTVSRVISPTEFETNRSVRVKADTKLVFAGVTAQAFARSDNNSIYNITVTNPGAGYTTAPNVAVWYNGSGNPATATAITNDDIINYINVTSAGNGYAISETISVDVVSGVELTTSNIAPYGSNTLYFANSDDLVPVQPGWLVFLITTINGDDIYTDFAQTPYATTDTTGPNDIDYRFFMDVTKTQAHILTVDTIDSDRLILSNNIDSLDSDGEQIDLPAGARVFLTAQNKFFTSDGRGSGSRVVGDTKTGFIVVNEVIDGVVLSLNSVLGIQPGMVFQTLADTLRTNIKVTAVDSYTNRITLTRSVTLPAATPVKISNNAKMQAELSQAEILRIAMTDEGAGYASAPVVTIEPRYPLVVQLATSLGGTNLINYKDINDRTLDVFYPAGKVLKVTSFTNIVIGSKVTSSFDSNGVGITTGSDIPTVVAFAYEQTASNTFEARVILDITQPAFSDVEVTFTLAAEALGLVTLENSAIDATDTTPETYEVEDTILVNTPANQTQTATNIVAYNQYYFDGTNWLPAQQKSNINQEPLFDAFNVSGYSAADGTAYPGSKFAGTKIFGYRIGTGAQDPVLRFPLVYRNFNNVGDIEFSNYFQNDTFNYLNGFNEDTVAISNFALKQKTDSGFKLKNIWSTVTEDSKQYQSIVSEFDGTTNYFELDAIPVVSKTIPYLKVYVAGKRVPETAYTVEQYGARRAVVINTSYLTSGSQVVIKVYSKEQSKIGQYETPINLDYNPLNNSFNFLTLGQIRNHLVTQTDNHYGLVGTTLGSNNLRDLNTKSWQGSILQHASSMSLPSLFMIDKDLDIIQSTEYAQREYVKFKNRFLDMASKIQINVKDIPGSVDTIMSSIMQGKSSMAPWYDSDMLMWGSKFKTTTTFSVLNVRQRTYLIPATFDPTVLSRRSVLVYLKDTSDGTYRQLVRDIDFTFATDISSIVIADHVDLLYTTQFDIVDCTNTTECYVPETPTKLGLYPKFIPTIMMDDTYRVPTQVIQGHDGSLTPAFGDYRDQLLMELELRIYNNIKISYDDTLLEIFNTIPGRFRETDYSRNEFDQLLTRGFLNWIGTNKLDYSANKWFNSNDAWSWNYKAFTDLQGNELPGYWRGIYKFYYDTDRPHRAPWEMLGFAQQPSWWEGAYGPAPYTNGNKVLWEDLEAGRILQGVRAGIDTRFARPGLSKIIPVDYNGNLIEPVKLLVANFNSDDTSESFAIGDHGPVETAWRRSSNYPYAVQIAMILARPAFYLGTLFDNSRYKYDAEIEQIVYSNTRQRLTPASLLVPNVGLGTSDPVLTAGYANWVRDYLKYKGIDSTAKMSNYLTKLDVRLSYRVAGFTDKKMLEVIAEQSSPGGSGRNIVVPDENYRVYLNKSTPVKRVTYSAVIVEKTDRGWKVSGYDTGRPYFTVVPSEPNNNAYTITEINQSVSVYRDYKLLKLTVPYGTEFTNLQQIADFFVSYSRYLRSNGFVFSDVDQDLGITRDWDLSIREFLTWIQQGWRTSSVLILSPIGSKVTVVSPNGVIDHISNKSDGNRLLDQNFSLIRHGEYSVTRDGGVFTATALYNKMIALADLTVVSYEHILIFDNTTVFNDVIYEPELGNRQYRLRLIGYKSGDWNGQLYAPGYIYNDEAVDEWKQNASYNLGSLVLHKDKYYMALQRVPESTSFDFTYWRPIDKDQIKTGLLTNFSAAASRFKDFYNPDQMTRHEDFDPYANGLIGFRNRDYLQDLGIDRTSQLKFYQGYIKQKGTKNAITSLTAGAFDRVTSEVSFYEEWALRVGEYGATGSDQFVELTLDEQQFTEDPSTVLLLDLAESPQSGVINFNPRTIYRTSEEVYNKNIIKARSDLLPRISDNVTAGYPRIDDIDGTIYNIDDYQNYFGLVSNLGAGYKLWVAVDTDKMWNVYRATETDILLIAITRVSATRVLFTFDKPHVTSPGELVVVKNFNDGSFDGFYRVQTVEDGLSITVTGYRGLSFFAQVSSATGSGVYLRMKSVRFSSVSNIIDFTPPHGWRNKDRVWIDNDTATDVWGVFEKTDGWAFNQVLPLRLGEDRYQEGYGAEVKLSVDNQLILAGTPGFTSGSLLGLRVLNPGANYDSPAVRISYPTGPIGQLAQFTALKDSGTLILANLVTAGYGYTFAPNVSIVDEYTTVTTAETLSDEFLFLSSGDMDKLYLGDFVSGRGIPEGSQVVDITLVDNKIKIDGPAVPSFASATNVTVGTGEKTFVTAVTADSTSIVANQGIRIYKFGDNNTYMEGYVVSFVGQTLVVEVEITQGTGSATSWVVTTALSVRSGTEVTFYRGTAGGVGSRLIPSSVDYIEVVDGGSGFVITPQVDIVGGGGSGARATAQVSGGVIQSIILTNPGSGYYETPEVTLLTNNPVTVDLRARLKATGVASLIITDKGQDYRDPVLVIEPDSRDRGVGATATLNFFGNGGVSSVTVTNRGKSYGNTSIIAVENSTTGSGFIGNVNVYANGAVGNVSVYQIGSGYDTVNATANIYYAGGSGATGNIGRTNNGIGEFITGTVISYGQGYLIPPTVEIIDQSGQGQGAVVEAVMPTGQVKTFLRPNQTLTNVEETQLIKPFNSDAREFGFSIDLGTTLGAIGAPGSYAESGGVLISLTLGSQWISYQMLYPDTLAAGDRFGHSVAMSDDQQWIYVGAPGANKVYCYGKRSQTYQRVTITPATNQLTYSTNLTGLRSAQELRVLGSNGKIYEPNFDYTVDSLGSIYWADYARIANQAKIYITRQRLQTTITPTVIRNLIQRTYQLNSRPETIDQLLVYGATGRVFVPNKEYTVVGSNLIFLDDSFLQEPTIVANQRDVFYQLVDTLEPTDSINADANFGWSVRVDKGGYRVLVGAPDMDDTNAESELIPSAGRAYVFSRSYEVILSIGTLNVFTLESVRPVLSVSLDSILLTENVDYIIQGNSVVFTATPRNGAKIKIDTNFFNIIQVIPCPSIINLGRFGFSVDIAPDNTSFAIGSPGYRDEQYYNGTVYRYVNKGLFYGTVTTEKDFMEVALNIGDTIKVNDKIVTFSGVTPGSITNVTAVLSSVSTTVSFTPNIGLIIGDTLSSPDVPAESQVKFLSWLPSNSGLTANITVSAPVTISTGDPISFIRAGDNLEKIKRNFEQGGLVAVDTVIGDGLLKITIGNQYALTRLDILPGVGTALEGIGLKVYELTQTLQHPRYGVPERFGTKVAIDNTGKTVLIASEGGNTLKTSTFDNETTLFDKDTTRFIDSLNASGAVYVYDYLNPPGETLANPGKLLYNQVLQNAFILTGDNFGSSIDINDGWALVGAENSSYHSTLAGATHLFVNDGDVKGWGRLRERGEQIDIDYINKGLIYDKQKQVNLKDLDYYDPAKGKILGIADQDLDYKSSYDPAQYNRGARNTVTIAADSSWGEMQEAQTWWDLSLARYINYEQGPINYRSNRWGQLFPDSMIQVCEWVGSNYLPSQYAEEIGDGQAKYPDDSAYVENTYFDTQSGLIKTKYYYWVINKQSIDSTKTSRTNSIVTIENLIEDPQSQGVPYFAAIASNAFNLYNVKNSLNSDRTIFRVEYSRVLGDIISHNEYELIQQGNANSTIPDKLISKLIDSLSGENSTGSVVPDLKLSDADAYGINNLPRQSMIKNAVAAVQVFVTFVNNILATKKITYTKDLARLLKQEPVPTAGTGYYDTTVDTVEQLQYIPDSELFVGYKVLVNADSDFFGYWTIYEYQQYVGFRMVRIQSYDTTRWWNYNNWYATDVDAYTDINYTVARYTDLLRLTLQVGNTVKVTDSGKGTYTVYRIASDGSLEEIIVEKGTIALSTALYDNAQSRSGFDNSAFDQVGFSTTQALELRNIFEALAYDIFIDTDSVETNNLFFTLLNYILSEQLSVDWAVKTSLISVLHKIRKLEQFPNYIKDNQDYYEKYINEVKPYRTQIREYLLDYTGEETMNAGLSDFDFPSYYDKGIGAYRILNPDNTADLKLIQNSNRNDWLQNYTYQIQSLNLNFGGSGYTDAPRVKIVGGGGVGATARAVILNGAVVDIILTNPGSGYTSTPTVEFTGGNGSSASAAVQLVQTLGTEVTSATLNKKIRSLLTKIKFDRVSYNTSLRSWKPYEIYRPGDLIVVDDVRFSNFVNYTERSLPRYSFVYRVLKTLTGRNTIDLNIFENPTIVQKLSGGDLDNAVDRLAAYNKPGSPDSARIYSSPNTIRLDPSAINDQIISVGRVWNAVRHSGFYPVQHGYQYAAVGDGSLIGLSKDGVTWVTNRITDTTINARDAFLYNNYTWVVVANQGAIYTTDNGIDWTREAVDQYYYDPSTDNPLGKLQENTAQTLDMTGGASVATTYGNYLLVVGNNGLILSNPRGNSNLTTRTFDSWYNIKVQLQLIAQNYLKVIAVDRGDLTDIDGTTYDVEIQSTSGYYVESANNQSKRMKVGVVFTAGVNGAINAITYNAFDDYMQGFVSGYNYNAGKNDDVNYPWRQLDVPVEVKGQQDFLSGQQLNSIVVSDTRTNWVVAVGSQGTLIWNQFNLPIQIQDGRAEIAPDTIGKTVVDYSLYMFNNFRNFNDSNFVAPLTREQTSNINFTDITWDGEKFIVVGTRSIILWGYPGVEAEAYIEIGSIDPTMSVASRRESASWPVGTGITSRVITIPSADLDASGIVLGMTCYADGLPDDAVVTGVMVGSSTHEITVSFAETDVAEASSKFVSFAYVLTDIISAGDTITTSNGTDTITLTVRDDVAIGDTRIYVTNYDDRVQSNWTIAGTGIPANARVRHVGKFANFRWQFAPGTVDNVNLDYRAVSVNTTVIEISKPLLPMTGTVTGVFAGNLVTFSDPTGTISQLVATQDLTGNLSVLTFANISQVEVGYTIQGNATMGIQDGTVVTKIVNYNIGGALSGLDKDIPDLIPGTGYTGSKVLGKAFTDTTEDALGLDTEISSDFTDSILGQRPEDITIDGGKFIDTYSSHAPEELVPGQVIDSLQMSVFTANTASGTPDYNDVIGYKIFTDYKLPSTYYRLSAANTTVLTANLSYNATEISILNANTLPDSGSVWINAEKIVYLAINRNNNKLQDLRRGTLRTSVAPLHTIGSLVTDATSSQLIATDITTVISEDVTVENGIFGGSNSATYLSSTTTSIYQGSIWVNL
jgi:hypothetical protein